LSKRGESQAACPQLVVAVHVEIRSRLVCRLLELEQLSEQDGLVTAWATASQPDGMAKLPALCTTPLAELTFATRRALVEGMGD